MRDYPVEAGLDPFFTTVTPADRLAILLDRIDELPLRRHEIRGNPAGLLARLLRRIDLLKSEAIDPARLRESAVASEREASAAAERERAEREIEFADLYARHDRILREAGCLAGGDLVLELGKLLRDRADVAEEIGKRFRHSLVDELEDAGVARQRLLPGLAPHGNIVASCDPEHAVRRFRGAGVAAIDAFRRRWPAVETIDLGESLRRPRARRFWRCENDRAQAQAAAREIEHLLAAGEVRPEAICVIVGSGWREARLVAAALEERSGAVPVRRGRRPLPAAPRSATCSPGCGCSPTPTDSAAVVRALTRPPVELRSIDLARCTAIARRRKLDMISALEAALESPQLPPEARDRIQAFLKLHQRRGPGAGGDARRRLRAAPDRADRLAPPSPLRRHPGDRGAAAEPLAALRARGRPGRGASRAARCATSSAT